MRGDGGVFDPVEMTAYLIGGVDAVVKIGDKAGDRSLEVDIVLPQRVVGVEEERLSG